MRQGKGRVNGFFPFWGSCSVFTQLVRVEELTPFQHVPCSPLQVMDKIGLTSLTTWKLFQSVEKGRCLLLSVSLVLSAGLLMLQGLLSPLEHTSCWTLESGAQQALKLGHCCGLVFSLWNIWARSSKQSRINTSSLQLTLSLLPCHCEITALAFPIVPTLGRPCPALVATLGSSSEPRHCFLRDF